MYFAREQYANSYSINRSYYAMWRCACNHRMNYVWPYHDDNELRPTIWGQRYEANCVRQCTDDYAAGGDGYDYNYNNADYDDD